ncbi:transposase [Testudinibacter sp. P80/BLE/0925]|uniref:transposase n=1 Tax=Testudinibacter sp. TW-1 TaxID=3417757 RepID=UPI003D36733B
MKNCPFCSKSTIQKYGTYHHIQRYKCLTCNKTFTLKNKLNSNKIWLDYTLGKQTYKQLVDKYHCSLRTIHPDEKGKYYTARLQAPSSPRRILTLQCVFGEGLKSSSFNAAKILGT